MQKAFFLISFYWTSCFCNFYSSFFYFIESVYFVFIETVSFVLLNQLILFLTKTRKNRTGLFYRYEVFFRISYISCVSRTKHPVFRGKITLRCCVSRKNLKWVLFFWKQKFPFRRQICPFGYLMKEIFLEVTKMLLPLVANAAAISCKCCCHFPQTLMRLGVLALAID